MSLPRRQTPRFARVWSQPRPTGTLLLISMLGGWGAAQGVMWLLDLTEMRDGLVLDGTGIRAAEYWRFATYQLIHAGPWHFLLTLSLLYFAGREVEPIISRRHVLGLCLTANLAGGVASFAVSPEMGIYGASSAAAAMIAVYATILPELEHRARVFWLIRFRTRHLLMGLLVFGAWSADLPVFSQIGPAGLLLGALLGWCWARALGFGRLFWFQRAAHERVAAERRRARMSAAEYIAEEVDPILEKIAREGLRSLTREERRLLEMAKEKIETKSA